MTKIAGVGGVGLLLLLLIFGSSCGTAAREAKAKEVRPSLLPLALVYTEQGFEFRDYVLTAEKLLQKQEKVGEETWENMQDAVEMFQNSNKESEYSKKVVLQEAALTRVKNLLLEILRDANREDGLLRFDTESSDLRSFGKKIEWGQDLKGYELTDPESIGLPVNSTDNVKIYARKVQDNLWDLRFDILPHKAASAICFSASAEKTFVVDPQEDFQMAKPQQSSGQDIRPVDGWVYMGYGNNIIFNRRETHLTLEWDARKGRILASRKTEGDSPVYCHAIFLKDTREAGRELTKDLNIRPEYLIDTRDGDLRIAPLLPDGNPWLMPVRQ